MPEHTRIRELFDRAIELPAHERDPFVRATAGDERTASRVLRLLENVTPASIIDLHPQPETEPPAPERIGRYRIIGTIGEGGFGVVYEAEQLEPVRRRVALKVIKAGMDSASVVARFEAERQALALMDHAGVARIFDGGVTEPELGSRPYFVMELVRGEPVHTYCDRHRLSVDQRVELFIRVCEAVHHAHTKGVIHRDLKPRNILVAQTEDGPTPKVIDFGISKAIDHRLSHSDQFTQQGQLIGTPEYMSPEQADSTDGDIDTRSDVYALGVILYELLSGRRPFESSELLGKGLSEIQRLLKEQDPKRPSTRINTAITNDTELAARLAESRDVEPRQLERRLRGELDWVVMKCLSKDRERRYHSAAGLGSDLRRFLAGEVVEARPPSRTYRFGKLVRRNKAATVSAVAIAGVLLVSTLVSIAFALESDRQRRLASEAELEALAARVAESDERERADTVLDAMIGAIQTTATDNRPDHIRAMLEHQGLRFESEEGGPDTGLTTLKVTPGELDISEFSRNLIDPLVVIPTTDALIEELAHDPDTLLGALERLTEQLLESGLYGVVAYPLEKMVEIAESHLGPDHHRTLEYLHNHGGALAGRGQHDEAKDVLQRAFEARTRVLGQHHPFTLLTSAALANLIAEQGDFATAAELLEDAYSNTLERLGPEHSNTRSIALSLASAHIGLDHPERALELLSPLMQSGTLSATIENDTQAVALNRTASLLIAQERFAEGLPLLEATMAYQREHLLPGDLETLNTAHNLGYAYLKLERFDEAEPLIRESLDGHRKAFGNFHLRVLSAQNNLGYLYSKAGEHDSAAQIFRDLIELYEDAFGTNFRSTNVARVNLAATLSRAGDFDESERLLLTAIERFSESIGPDHRLTLQARGNLAELHKDAERFDTALPMLRSVYADEADALGPDDPLTLTTGHALAELLIDLDKPAEAAPILREVHERRAGTLGEDHPDTAKSAALLEQLNPNKSP